MAYHNPVEQPATKPRQGQDIPLDGFFQRLRQSSRYLLTGKADWFGPGQPTTAMAPAEVEGRQTQYQIAVNQLIQRKIEGIGFERLRLLSDTCDIFRLLIENRKNSLVALRWTVQKMAPDAKKKPTATSKTDKTADMLEDFFACPDKDHEWSDWLRMLLEDKDALDAATLYIQKTKGGDLYALRPVDGATIKRIIDQHGWTPTPPTAAYQQILYGIPAINYTLDEIIYRPMNPRTNRIYGMGRIEQTIVTAATWLARQASNLEYYESGSVPDGFLTAHKDWGPQQIDLYTKLLNEQLSGQLAERRKVYVVPADSKYTSTKEPALKGEYDEWLARIACFCWGTAPTPFIKQMNRATADTAKETSAEEGLEADKAWVKRLIDHVIKMRMGLKDYEFVWEDKEAQDPLERAQVDKIYVDAGVVTPNEIRGDLGLDPLPEPEEDLPYRESTEAPLPSEDVASANPASVNGGSVAQNSPPGSKKKSPNQGSSNPNGTKVARAHFHKIAPDKSLSANSQQAMQELAQTCRKAFARLRVSVIEQLAEKTQKMAKAGPKKTDYADQAERVVIGLKLDPLSAIWEDAGTSLSLAAQDGSRLAIATISAMPGEEVTADSLFNRAFPEADTWAAQHVGELITKDGNGGPLADATRNMLRRTITQAMSDNLSEAQLAAILQTDYAFSDTRAELIARTEIGNANAHGQLTAYAAAGMKSKQWLLSNLDNPCPICTANADAGWIEIDKDFPGGVKSPLQHPNCFVGDTPVQILSPLLATTERHFNGRIAIIRTAGGKQLTCTPNHPILTDHGWVAAGSLHVGSNVVCYLGIDRNDMSADLASLDNQHMPASIKEIARAFRCSPNVISMPVPTASEDFHGDGEGSEIAIVGTNGQLRNDSYLADFKEPNKLSLERINGRIESTGGGSPEKLALGDNTSECGAMSLGDLSLALGLSHAGPTQSISSTSVAERDASIQKPTVDDAAVHFEPFTESKDALTTLIKFDQIANIDFVDYSGHVFNLQTESGWYIADGIVTHNCRCVLVARREAPQGV